nr:MAG TPA: hypothetical protein [Bacteriophage sp.]
MTVRGKIIACYSLLSSRYTLQLLLLAFIVLARY